MDFRNTCKASAIVLSLLIVSHLPYAQGQTTGAIDARVVDSQNKQKGLEGSYFRLVNLRNGVDWTQPTNGGRWIFTLLPPGRYSLTASNPPMYNSRTIPSIEVPLNTPTQINPAIELMLLGKAQNPPGTRSANPLNISLFQTLPTDESETPYCRKPTGSTSLVSLRDWALRWNLDSCRILVLPLRGSRSFDQLALFAPGVARAPFSAGEGPAVGIGVGSIGQFSVNGLRSRSNNFTVDGSDNNDEDIGVRRQGFVALVPQSIESIEEYQVMTAGVPADFGRNSGSMVNAVSRSGEEHVHGTIYGLFNNDVLSARNPFDTNFTDAVNSGDRNGGRYSGKDSSHSLYGGAFGGPIDPLTRHFFYFVSAERQRVRGTALRHFVVPTSGERGLRVNSGQSNGFVPIEKLQDFFNQRSISYSSAAGAEIFSLYPLPNNPAGPFGEHNYSQVNASTADSNVFSQRLDWFRQPGNNGAANYNIAARYNFTGDQSTLPFTGDAINSALATSTRTQNFSLVINMTKKAYANSLRVSYGRTRLSFPLDKGSPLIFGSSATGGSPTQTRQIETPYGRFGPFGATGPIGQLSILPYSSVGIDVYNFPQGRVDNTYQIGDVATFVWKTHALRAGFDLRHSQLNSFADRNSRPLIVFGFGSVGSTCLVNPFCAFATKDGQLTGTDLAALGAASGVLQTLSTDPAADTTIGLRLTQYDFFFQDDWRARPNLTLNLGIRYELQTVPHEANRRIEKTFGVTPDQFGHLQPAGSANDQAVIAAGNRAFDQAVNGLQTFLDGRRRIYDLDTNNLAPRIGFAWDPFGSATTAIRGGFGLQFDANPAAFTSQSRNVFPTFVPVNFDLNFNRPNGQFINNPSFFTFLSAKTPLIRPGTLNVYNLTGDAFATGLGTLFNQQPANPTDNLSANGLAFTLPEKNLQTGLSRQYVLSAEHEFSRNRRKRAQYESGDSTVDAPAHWLGSLAYVGTQGIHLPRFTTPNGGFISAPLLLSSVSQPLTVFDLPPYGRRPVPSLGAFTVMENSASSSYHSMQLSVLRRSAGGLDFRSSWTWSHAMDEVSDMFDARSFFALPEDIRQPNKDRASANFDVRHRVSGIVSWNGFRQWDLSLTAEYQTGQPYTINTVVDRNGDGNLTDRPGIGRNTTRAPGVRTVDAAIRRRFSRSSKLQIEAGAEIFNILNLRNLGVPVRILESPGFRSSFDTALDPRAVRVTTKFSF